MNESNAIELNLRYNKRLDELMSLKSHNTQFFTEETYVEMIEKVKSSKSKVSNKKPDDYQRLRRFDVMTIGGSEKLIVPIKEDNVIKFYVHKDEIFQIIQDIHLATGHGGRNRMVQEINLHFRNITREMVVIFLNLCESCEKKHKRDLMVKPNLCREKNGRCQIDLIGMESQEEDQYKFILVYEDQLTKFVQLRPLKTNSIKEVAGVLLDIFTIFGVPSILQSNDRKLAKNVVHVVCEKWPGGLKIRNAKPKHDPSQGSVDQTSHIVANMVRLWLKENHSKEWYEGLGFVQLMKNTTHQTGINCSPYDAMFSSKLNAEIKSSPPQNNVIKNKPSEPPETMFNSTSNYEQLRSPLHVKEIDVKEQFTPKEAMITTKTNAEQESSHELTAGSQNSAPQTDIKEELSSYDATISDSTATTELHSSQSDIKQEPN